MSDPATNGYDANRASQVIEAIEGMKAEQRRLKEEAAAKLAPKIASLSAEIGAKFKEAKKAWGLNTATLKAQLKLRELQRKQNELVESLDDDTQEDLEKLRGDLGTLADLPLGSWFLASKGDGEGEAEAAAEAPPKAKRARAAKAKQLHDELDQMGADDQTATNVTRLETGIRPLKGTAH